MIKGSHNTMSYLRARHWWMRPLEWMARCQDMPVEQQFWAGGVRMFDLRVRFDNDGRAMFAHGLISYESEHSVDYVLTWLEQAALKSKNKVYVRLMLETFRAASDYQVRQFEWFTQGLKERYPHLTFEVYQKNPHCCWWSDVALAVGEVRQAQYYIQTLADLLRGPRAFLAIQRERLEQWKAEGFKGVALQDFVENVRDKKK